MLRSSRMISAKNSSVSRSIAARSGSSKPGNRSRSGVNGLEVADLEPLPGEVVHQRPGRGSPSIRPTWLSRTLRRVELAVGRPGRTARRRASMLQRKYESREASSKSPIGSRPLCRSSGVARAVAAGCRARRGRGSGARPGPPEPRAGSPARSCRRSASASSTRPMSRASLGRM